MKLPPVLQLEGHRLSQLHRFSGGQGELCNATSSLAQLPLGSMGKKWAGRLVFQGSGRELPALSRAQQRLASPAVPGRGPLMPTGAAAGAFGPTSSGLSACRCLVDWGLDPSGSASMYSASFQLPMALNRAAFWLVLGQC